MSGQNNVLVKTNKRLGVLAIQTPTLSVKFAAVSYTQPRVGVVANEITESIEGGIYFVLPECQLFYAQGVWGGCTLTLPVFFPACYSKLAASLQRQELELTKRLLHADNICASGPNLCSMYPEWQ